MALALKMKEEFLTKWRKLSKIDVARSWAIELKIPDPTGLKTKIHVNQMLEKYKRAKVLSNQTGFGDIETSKKEGGKMVMKVVSALQQLLAICPTFEVLNSFLEEQEITPEDEEEKAASAVTEFELSKESSITLTAELADVFSDELLSDCSTSGTRPVTPNKDDSDDNFVQYTPPGLWVSEKSQSKPKANSLLSSPFAISHKLAQHIPGGRNHKHQLDSIDDEEREEDRITKKVKAPTASGFLSGKAKLAEVDKESLQKIKLDKARSLHIKGNKGGKDALGLITGVLERNKEHKAARNELDRMKYQARLYQHGSSADQRSHELALKQVELEHQLKIEQEKREIELQKLSIQEEQAKMDKLRLALDASKMGNFNLPPQLFQGLLTSMMTDMLNNQGPSNMNIPVVHSQVLRSLTPMTEENRRSITLSFLDTIPEKAHIEGLKESLDLDV
ncbi:hypothetical protein EV426DRAFT_708157 [Tirmania nivea]|nr:hypothetical protein EV426DRAFT_708157 [Tirmania nivea]